MEHELTKLCVWREARGENFEGLLAVCWVIKNRMTKQKKTSFEIVTAQNQFSSMTIHSDPQVTLYPHVTDQTFEFIDNLFNQVLVNDPQYPDNTAGATFYRNVATADSVWFDNAVRDGKLVETVQVGKHTFYKEI